MSNNPKLPLRSHINRRAFLKHGSLFLAGTSITGSLSQTLAGVERSAHPSLKIGMFSDIHYADRAANGTRHYRDSIKKMREAAQKFKRSKIDLGIELGDCIDLGPDIETEIGYLKSVHAEFTSACKDRHYVLGNHCVASLTKEEFLDTIGTKASYYSFDRDKFHFVILDACYRSDGVSYQRNNFNWADANIPKEQIDWLKSDLASTTKPTICAIHQRLDVGGHMGVNNAHAVRSVLEKAGNVLAVFQGHNHINDYNHIGGIHYCTLRSMVDGPFPKENGYAVVELFDDGSIRINGFRLQATYQWRAIA